MHPDNVDYLIYFEIVTLTSLIIGSCDECLSEYKTTELTFEGFKSLTDTTFKLVECVVSIICTLSVIV